MTLEELQAELETLKNKSEDDAERIKALNAESAKWRRLAQGKDDSSSEVERLERELNDATTKLKEFERANKTLKAEFDKSSLQLTETDKALKDYLIDGGLTDGLAKARVKPELMDAAKALLKAQALVKADGGKYQALMGDKPLQDAITEWVASDTGKHFVQLPDSSGGGAIGSGNSGGTGKKFAEMTSEERTALFRSDPKQYEALKASK